MKYIEVEDGLIIKSWCNEPEENAIAQARNLARLPFAYKQICLLPDCHCGYGMPIGGVMALIGVVVANAVGLDVGCGMCAVKTSLTEITTETLKKILGGSKEYHSGIRSCIPVGFNHQSKRQDDRLMPQGFAGLDMPVVSREYNSALKQIGTLGGGNHFIEIQKGDDGHIWIMIHSGSRNLGKQVAEHYNKIAIELNEKYFSKVPKNWELAFLPIDSEEGQLYLNEMNYCVDFALANRRLMMDNIMGVFYEITGCEFEPMINIAHNYARMEHHFNKNVMIHRKGATSARLDEIGIIPGSQGTPSYIVKGLGNPESFESCSHGAGRKMGRKEAQRSLNLEEEQAKLDSQGILHSVRGVNDLDEASGSYKDIDIVMKEQEDLVVPIIKLQPLAVVKG
jgi:tRNA-splicing ligase RtcB